MGLDFIIKGVTLSKRKVEQKGLQHFINDSRYYNYLDENYELNFETSFRKPDEFMGILVQNATKYYDENYEYDEGKYVLTQNQLIELIDNSFNEEMFKYSDDEYNYYHFMSMVCDARKYNNKFYDFYLIMRISV